MVMTLGILYVFLPRYYFNHMTNQLDRQADALVQNFEQGICIDDVAMRISEFSLANNAFVVPYNAEGQRLIHLITPHIFNTAVMNIDDSALNNETGIRIQMRDVDAQERFIAIPTGEMPIIEGHETFVVRSRIHVGPTIISGNTGGFMILGDNGNQSVSFARAVSHPDIDHLVFSSTLQPIDQAQDVIVAMIPYLVAVGFAIALVMAFAFSKLLTKPIIKIADAAGQMRQMQPGVVSAVNTNDELGLLSRNLDNLYKDLRDEITRTAKLEESKTNFMRAAGHELKTPLSALSGMLDGMIDKVGVYKNHEKYLPELKLQTERLSKLVHDILMASQTDDISGSFEITPVDVDHLINETIQQYTPLIDQKKLEVNISHGNNFCFNTDKHAIFIILSNLISNAVKYSPEGGVIRIGTATYTRGKVLFIENSCTNINEDLIPKWFEPFFTPDYSRDKSKGGTGLGLYIVKKNLDALGLPFEMAVIEGGLRFEILLFT